MKPILVWVVDQISQTAETTVLPGTKLRIAWWDNHPPAFSIHKFDTIEQVEKIVYQGNLEGKSVEVDRATAEFCYFLFLFDLIAKWRTFDWRNE